MTNAWRMRARSPAEEAHTHTEPKLIFLRTLKRSLFPTRAINVIKLFRWSCALLNAITGILARLIFFTTPLLKTCQK